MKGQTIIMDAQNRFKRYEVETEKCSINIYDRVTPDTIIGYAPDDGRTVTSGTFGRVASTFYDLRHNSVFVTVLCDLKSLSDSGFETGRYITRSYQG
jgi:hypothetical protein